MNGLSVREVVQKLESARETLFEARSKRPRPHRDDKIIAAWNGLMISAFARAGVAFNQPKWKRAAVNGARFVLGELWDGKDLYRHFKDGRADVRAYADDYAAMARACLDLYDATFDVSWIERAEMLADRMAELFFDEKSGGFWNSMEDPQVPVRFKEDYDGAEPSASSLALEVGARLFHLVGRDDWRERAERTARSFAERLESIPSSMPLLLRGQMLLQNPPQHVVIAGGKEESAALLEVAQSGYAPSRFVVLLDERNRAWWGNRQEFLRDMKPLNDEATAYVCQNFACQSPTTRAEDVQRLLTTS